MPDTAAEPVALAVQDENEPPAPPAGTASVKLRLLPDTVPDTVPVAVVPVPLSVSVSVPENDVPDCVSAHVIWPGPDESDAVPDHEPLTLAVVVEVEPDGVVGVEPPPPLHPTVTSATPRTAPARTPENRVRIMGNLADSSTAQFTQPERSTLL